MLLKFPFENPMIRLGLLATGLFCVIAIIPTFTVAADSDRVKLIFDTDMGNDVDDAMALAMVHTFQSRGNCELLAVTLTIPHRLAGVYTHALNTFYGRPEIPIGINPNAPDGFFPDMDFLRLVQRRDRYPSNFDPETAIEALPLLRKTLAAAEDNSIVIVQVGTFTNMADLLRSEPDEFSPLTGKELVEKKVRLLSLMGGDFVQRRTEYNVRLDVPSAREVTDNWPTPIVWSGSEVGDAITYPATSIQNHFNYVEYHIIKESYQNYKPVPHERPTWDLTSVFYAVHPTTELFTLSEPGNVQMSRRGVVQFVPAEGGRDRYLKVNDEQAEILRKLFAILVSAPPDHLR